MSVLTPALEDYLESIFLLAKDCGHARVRDIANARTVKAASVSPALKRLSDLGYVTYERREYITLTPAGEAAARQVYARHVMLHRFFHEILGMEANAAEHEACELEHSLSDEGMLRFFTFFERLINDKKLVEQLRLPEDVPPLK